MIHSALDNSVLDLTRSIGLLLRRIRKAAGDGDLSLTEAAVLKRLYSEGAATIADLARSEGMRPQSMGTTVAALEEMGLVERRPHPTDGRQVNIEITARGRAMRKSAVEAKNTWLAKAIAGLDHREQQTLFAAGKIIERMVKQ